MPYDPSLPIDANNYPGMPDNGDNGPPGGGHPGGDPNANPGAGANQPPGTRPTQTGTSNIPAPPPTSGNEDEQRGSIIEYLAGIFRWGIEGALYRFGLTNDDLDRLLESQGLSPEQIANLREHEQFREGIRSGELVSPDLRNALDDIEGLEGRMNQILDEGGRTELTQRIADRAGDIVDSAGFGRMPELQAGIDRASELVEYGGQTAQTQELFDLGTELVRDRGFTPEFRDAFDRLLNVVTADEGTPGAPGTTSAFSPALTALQNIIQSEGAEGAGIIPLEDVVGLAEAQAGERSAQIAEAAQRESARRGLGPGAVTSGTEVAAESGQLQLNQETAAVAQAVSSNQALRGAAVSQALQGLVQLAEVQQNDPIRGQQADVLGELIRATVTNIQTGANLGIGSQRLANERLGLGLQGIASFSGIAAGREGTAFQSLLGAESLEQGNRQHAVNTILAGNQTQANVGVNLQNQFLQSLGQSGTVAQQGQQNYLDAIGLHQQLGMGLLGIGGQALGGLTGPANLQSGPSWWERLLPGLLNIGGRAAGGLFSRPERFEPSPRGRIPPERQPLPTDIPPPDIPTTQAPGPTRPPGQTDPGVPDVHSTITYPGWPQMGPPFGSIHHPPGSNCFMDPGNPDCWGHFGGGGGRTGFNYPTWGSGFGGPGGFGVRNP